MLDLAGIIAMNDNPKRFGLQPLPMTSEPKRYTGIAIKEDGTPFLVRCECTGWLQEAKKDLEPLARAQGGRLLAAIFGYSADTILTTWHRN